MKKFYLKVAILAGFAILSQHAISQVTVAEDNASGYTTETWTTYNSQGGSGFTPWIMFTMGLDNNPNGVAGHMIDSSVNAGFGDIDTEGNSFCMYGYRIDNTQGGNPEAVVFRYFNNTGADVVPNTGGRTPLLPGQEFAIDLAVAFRNGYKGIDLLNSNGERQWNFGMDGDIRYEVNQDPIFDNTYIQQSVFKIRAIQLTANTYQVTITRGEEVWGPQTYTGSIGGIKMYESTTRSSNPLNRLYFNNLKVVQCPDETTWDGETWSNGEPAIYKRVIINGNYTSATSISACTLTVNNGAVVNIQTGHTLTVSNTIDVETGSSLTIENNAALVQINKNAQNNGQITVKRNSNALYRLDYTLWGAPVSGQELQAFSPATFNTRFYTYAYNWQANATPEATYNELYWQTSPLQDFVPGKGYLIRMPNIITAEEAETQSETENMPDVTAEAYNTIAQDNSRYIFPGVFTGTINNGLVAVPLTVSNTNPAQPGNLSQAGHYTAVANPYASPISVYEFFSQNSNVLSAGDGIYFWRKKNDSEATSYSCLTMAGYVENEAGGSTGNNTAFYPSPVTGAYNRDWIISPGQGFIVKIATDAAESNNIVFNNTMRRPAPATGGQPFFKTMNTNDAPSVSKFWLNLTDTNNKFGQTAIAYMPEATNGLDFALDGKLMSGGNISFYSLVNTNKLSIQARPSFTDSDTVPLGFTATAAGQYTISLNRTEGIFTTDQDIYLKDNLNGTTINLKEADYTFTTENGTFNTRFEIVYLQGQLGTATPELENAVIVYQNNNTINITSGAISMNSVVLYDIMGRKLYEANNLNASELAIKNLNTKNEVIIARITTPQGTVSKKIIH